MEFCLIRIGIGHPNRYLYYNGWFFYPWVVAGGFFVVIATVSYFRFVMDLPSQVRRLTVLSGALYIGGALGMDLIESGWDFLRGRDTWRYAAFVAL